MINEKKNKSIHFKISIDLKKELFEIAEAKHINISHLLRFMVLDYIKKERSGGG